MKSFDIPFDDYKLFGFYRDLSSSQLNMFVGLDKLIEDTDLDASRTVVLTVPIEIAATA